MSLQQIDFSKTLTDDDVYDGIMNNYTDESCEEGLYVDEAIENMNILKTLILLIG